MQASFYFLLWHKCYSIVKINQQYSVNNIKIMFSRKMAQSSAE